MSTSHGPVRVAFQGERGAFSEEAAVKLLGEGAKLVPRPTFESLKAPRSPWKATHTGPLDVLISRPPRVAPRAASEGGATRG